MEFQTIKTAIKTILAAGQSTNYETNIGQKQSRGASEMLIPRVAVFYESGSFPKGSGSVQSAKKHNATYRIEISVAVQNVGDIATLNNDAATGPQKAAALSAFIDLAEKADDAWDQAFADVYQVIMAANKRDLDLAVGTAIDLWLDSPQKGSPLDKGQLLVLVGSCIITVSMEEVVTGITGTPGTSFDITTDIVDDQGDNAGASGTLGGN